MLLSSHCYVIWLLVSLCMEKHNQDEVFALQVDYLDKGRITSKSRNDSVYYDFFVSI